MTLLLINSMNVLYRLREIVFFEGYASTCT